MSSLLEKILDLNDLVLQGKAIEAFEKYYNNQAVMQENNGEPTIGKAANRKQEETFFDKVTEFREVKPLKVAIGEDGTIVEWLQNYTHKERGILHYTQVSVQEWQDGQIIKNMFGFLILGFNFQTRSKEKFYYQA